MAACVLSLYIHGTFIPTPKYLGGADLILSMPLSLFDPCLNDGTLDLNCPPLRKDILLLITLQSFFLTAPRSWSKATDQDPSQQYTVAAPMATDGRFKAGSIFLCVSWAILVYYTYHNMYFYRQDQRRPLYRFIVSPIKHNPLRFNLAMILIAIRAAYGVASAWNFDISLMKYNVTVFYPFVFGYTPTLLPKP